MNKQNNKTQIISLVGCIIVVAVIVGLKVKEFQGDSVTSAPVQEEMAAPETQTDKTSSADHAEAAGEGETSGKKRKVKEDTMPFGEETEDCGTFYTVDGIRCKEAKDSSGKEAYRYVITCDVRNGCRGEKISLEDFARHFSVEAGETEKNAVLKSGKKELAYNESEQIKMSVSWDEKPENPGRYKVFYTTDEDEDEDLITVFRTEFVEKSAGGGE